MSIDLAHRCRRLRRPERRTGPVGRAPRYDDLKGRSVRRRIGNVQVSVAPTGRHHRVEGVGESPQGSSCASGTPVVARCAAAGGHRTATTRSRCSRVNHYVDAFSDPGTAVAPDLSCNFRTFRSHRIVPLPPYKGTYSLGDVSEMYQSTGHQRVRRRPSRLARSTITPGQPYCAAQDNTEQHAPNSLQPDLGAGGREFESPHPDTLDQV